MRFFLMYRYRPWGTGDCLRRALESRGHIVWTVDTRPFAKGAWSWEEYWKEVKGFNADAMVCIGLQDGLPKGFKVYGFPVIHWALTDPLCLAGNLVTAQAADLIFVAQKKYLPFYRKNIKTKARWLPLAFDSIGLSGCLNKTKPEYDVAFIGSPYKGRIPQRNEWLDELRKSFNIYTSSACFLHEMRKVYSCSAIVYNYSVKDDLNMRIFEAMGSGRLLITNRLSLETGFEDLFEEKRQYVAYGSLDDLINKIYYYLRNPEEREQIAFNGQEEVFLSHTFLNRADEIIKAVKKLEVN